MCVCVCMRRFLRILWVSARRVAENRKKTEKEGQVSAIWTPIVPFIKGSGESGRRLEIRNSRQFDTIYMYVYTRVWGRFSQRISVSPTVVLLCACLVCLVFKGRIYTVFPSSNSLCISYNTCARIHRILHKIPMCVCFGVHITSRRQLIVSEISCNVVIREFIQQLWSTGVLQSYTLYSVCVCSCPGASRRLLLLTCIKGGRKSNLPVV